MGFIIVDLEATCWEKRTRCERMEIIEIGDVRMPAADADVTDEFASFVRPGHANPTVRG